MNTLDDKAASIKLRPAHPEDEPFLFAVYCSTRVEELALTNWAPPQKDSFLRMQFEAQRRSYSQQMPNAEHFVIQCDGATAGRMILDRRDTEIALVDLALLPEFRQRKIGSRLMAELLEDARLHHKGVRLHVERFNPALQWYQRLGFTIIGDAGLYLEMLWRPPGEETRSDQIQRTA